MKLNWRSAKTPRGLARAIFTTRKWGAICIRILTVCIFGGAAQWRALAAPDVTSQVELLGNPFSNRYDTAASQPAREARRMRLFNNRIYLGHGTTTTALNTSPIDTWSFDLGQDAFIKDGVIFEEQIDQLRVFGDRLYVNGVDSMGQGQMYRLDTTKGWQAFKVGTGIDGHYRDIYEFNGKIFSTMGVTTWGFPRIAISTDDGVTWTQPTQSIDGKDFAATTASPWEFQEFNGNLYWTYLRSGSSDIVDNPPFMVKYTGNEAAPVEVVHWLHGDFYEGAGITSMPVQFTQLNANMAVFAGNLSLFYTTDIEAPDSAIKLADPAGLGPADNLVAGTGVSVIRKHGSALYMVYNIKVSGVYWVVLCESTDGINWTEKFRFNKGSRAKSFERAPNGDFYFGAWGVLSGQGEALVAGDIWRVRADAVDLPALPSVNVSADDLTVFEGSGSGLSLRIRRSGSTAGPLTVNYTTSGTAVAGTDYTALSGSAVIPGGANSVDVPISILVNPAETGARTLGVTLSADAAYTIATPASIEFTITDETAGGTTLPQDGLALWLRADQGVTTSAGQVTGWADQSGRGYAATQATASMQPAFVASGLNGRPAVDFDGANDWMDIGPIAAEAYFTAIVFSNDGAFNSGSSARTLINFMSYAEGSGSGLDLGAAQSVMSGEAVGTYFQAWAAGGATLAAGNHRLIWSQPAASEPFALTIDGDSKPVSTPASLRLITPNCDDVKLGSKNGSSRFFSGTISEIIIYKRPLSAAEEAIVEAYLSQRYFAANNNPVANADEVTRAPGAFIDIPAPALTANDTDADGDPLTILSVGSALPAGASVTFDGSTIRYTPPLNNNANGSFTYELSDSGGGTATGMVTVNVTNADPVANNDSFERQSLNDLVLAFGDVLGNDSDPDLDPLTVSSVEEVLPSGATVSIEGANIRYHPPVGFNGTDEFDYTISDGRGLSDTATVTVTVSNAAPAPGTDFRTTSVGQALLMTIAGLLGNDTDIDGDAIGFVSAETRSAEGGVVRLSSSTGQLTYVPRSGFSGTDSFHYTIQDARGLSAEGTVEVSVVVSNLAPTPGADMFTRLPDKSITILFSELLANDTDLDGDALTVVSVMGRTAAGAKVVLSATGMTYSAPAGFNGGDVFSYTVRDSRGALASATVTIKVGVASPKAAALSEAEVLRGVTLKTGSTRDGKLAVSAVAAAGCVLQIEVSEDLGAGDWLPHCQIRAGQDGVAYFEEETGGSGRVFKATVIAQ